MTENSKRDTYKLDFEGLITKEKNTAKKLFNEYRDKYHVENFSDLQILQSLVFREILQIRTKKKIASLNKNRAVKEAQIIPRHLIDSLDNNEEKILILKDKLGFFSEKKESNTWLEFWERLKKKLQLHAETHRAECTFKCPYCKEYTLLLMKIDDFNTFKFNWLKGTFVYNKELMQEIEKGTLTKQRVAEIMGVSIDYIEGLYEKVYLKEKRKAQ